MRVFRFCGEKIFGVGHDDIGYWSDDDVDFFCGLAEESRNPWIIFWDRRHFGICAHHASYLTGGYVAHIFRERALDQRKSGCGIDLGTLERSPVIWSLLWATSLVVALIAGVVVDAFGNFAILMVAIIGGPFSRRAPADLGFVTLFVSMSVGAADTMLLNLFSVIGLFTRRVLCASSIRWRAVQQCLALQSIWSELGHGWPGSAPMLTDADNNW